jgi:hypothetical protein
VKRIVLLTILFLLCIHSFAQKIQFTNNTNVWSVIDSTIGCCIPIPTAYTTAHYDITVSVNGRTYQRLYDPQVGDFLVREDSNRVYLVQYNTDDSSERVLYDFNLQQNDTLRTVYTQDTYVAWVSTLDSTQIYGTWYKVWHFTGLDYGLDSTRNFSYNVIEGMGCTNGPYYPASPYALTAFSEQLLCFKNDMGYTTALSNSVLAFGHYYTSSFDNYNSCNDFIINPALALGVSQVTAAGNVSVVPDPINENSKIIVPYLISSGSLVIVHELGQMVTNTTFQNKNELPIGNIVSARGIYFYRVTDNQSGKFFSGKFVNR